MPWKPTDVAYLAGLMDGEGSIVIFRYLASPHQRNGKRYPRYRACVSVYNTDRRPLDWIAETFGGKVYGRRNTIRNQKEELTWQASYRQALPILEAVLPYLKIKAEQARLYLGFYGNGLVGNRWGRRGTPAHIAEARASVYATMSDLNRKGVLEDI